MYRRFHDRFGTAGVVIAIVALVAALGGTALAAGGGLTAKQKKEVKAIAKSFQGTGPQGEKGSPGANGTNGTAGSNGAPGANGKSVTTGNATGAECPEGGATVEVEGTPASKKKVCNGEEGPQGPAGPSCNASGECLLPAGATETGVWRFQKPGGPGGLPTYIVSISFPLRLTSAPEFKLVTPANSGTAGAVSGCPGTAAEPKAAAGKFCFYEKEHDGVEETIEEPSPDLTSGMFVNVEAFSPEEAESASGTWAVKR